MSSSRKTFQECYQSIVNGEVYEAPKQIEDIYDAVGQPTFDDTGRVSLNECYDKILMGEVAEECEGPTTISEAYEKHVETKFQAHDEEVSYTEFYLS